MDSEEKENKELSTQYFLSALSHELRQPLNGVVGYNQLLLQTKVSSTQKTYLMAMNKCCIQLLELLNDIIDYSRLSIGKMSINKECFSIKEVTDVVDNTLNFRLKEKRQKFQWIISRNLPEYIVSDRQKVIQILVNLVSNANKFTDKGGFISVHISPKQKNIIEFTVKDNGCGIAKKDQDNLFNAFVQVEQSVCKTGSGLGLAISKKLTELLGGIISVDSTIGKGSTFSFTITYEVQETEVVDIGKCANSLRDKYVLVVDDNLDNRIIFGEMLFEWRMKPVVCASALEALRLIIKQRYRFAFAIIDICMPGMSGVELAKEIKKENRDLPLLALSSSTEPIDTADFEQVVTKPINKSHLLSSIQKIIKRGNVSIDSTDYKDTSLSVSKDIKILIAEDVIDNLTLTITMLESMGYTDIDTAINGKETILKIDKAEQNNEPYDILLLDLRMPILDGFKVIEHIRLKEYKLNIVVITASILDTDRNRCKELGIKFFIVKPIEMIQLRNVMSTVKL